jgi:hypothetical protein
MILAISGHWYRVYYVWSWCSLSGFMTGFIMCWLINYCYAIISFCVVSIRERPDLDCYRLRELDTLEEQRSHLSSWRLYIETKVHPAMFGLAWLPLRLQLLRCVPGLSFLVYLDCELDFELWRQCVLCQNLDGYCLGLGLLQVILYNELIYVPRWTQTLALRFGTTMVYVEVFTVQSMILQLVLSLVSRVWWSVVLEVSYLVVSSFYCVW